MMDWVHMLVIVQCQTYGCSLSCKDGAVVWQSFGQLAAGVSTILEMVVDDRRCPHFLVNFGAINVDFIMWSLCFTILIELSLGFSSGDHAFIYSFSEVVSLGIIVVRSWWKVGCPQGGDQSGMDLCRGHDLLYFQPMGGAGGLVMPPLPFGLGAYKSLVVRSNSCRAWCAGLSLQARVFT